MKTISKSTSSDLLTYWPDRPSTYALMPAARNIVTPIPEINPGNGIDPTDWKYTIDHIQRFLGHKRYKSNPAVGHIGPIGTGEAMIREYTPWERSNLYTRALNRLNDKAHERSDWSEDVFQAPKTARLGNLVGNARDMLRDAIKSERKRNGSSLGSSKPGLGGTISGASKLAASMQLQTAYAIKPLIGNIYDTANAIVQAATTTGMQIRGGAKQTIHVDSRVNNAEIYCSNKEVYHTERGMMGVRIHVNVNALNGFNPLDWTTLNPLLLGWNLVPYSFVADWFFDVGGYLENIENAFRNNGMFRSGYVTYLYANYVTEVVKSASSSSTFIIDFARARRKLVFFEREVLHAWPLPRAPRLNVDLGSGQLLSAAALLRGLLK